MSKLSQCFVCMLFFASTQVSLAGDQYFMLMFAGQRASPSASNSHSFAMFVKACDPSAPASTAPIHANSQALISTPVLNDAGPTKGATPVIVEKFCIGWVPASLQVRMSALFPEAGCNLDLDASVAYCCQHQMRVSVWGAYQIQPELYERAKSRLALLNSGRVAYKAVDTGWHACRTSNCIHSIAAIVDEPKIWITSPAWGEVASQSLLKQPSPWIIEPTCVHAWVGQSLGLSRYSLIYRDVFPAPSVPARIIPHAKQKCKYATFGPPTFSSPALIVR